MGWTTTFVFDGKLLDGRGRWVLVLMFRWVYGMSDEVFFKVKDVLKGQVDVELLTSRYVILHGMFSHVKNMAKAANYMAKFGWRVVGWSSGYLMLERNAS